IPDDHAGRVPAARSRALRKWRSQRPRERSRGFVLPRPAPSTVEGEERMAPPVPGDDRDSVASDPSESASSTSQGVRVSTVSEIRITLDGTERAVAAGTTAGEALSADGRTVIAARVNGQARDLDHVLADGDVVEPIAIDSEEGRAILRHSTAHVLAQAVQDLFPEAKLGIGPPVENGF